MIPKPIPHTPARAVRPAFAALMLFVVAAGCPEAWAYIGPGAGVSFLGSLWAILVGIVLALAAILFWPIRWALRRLRKPREPQAGPRGRPGE